MHPRKTLFFVFSILLLLKLSIGAGHAVPPFSKDVKYDQIKLQLFVTDTSSNLKKSGKNGMGTAKCKDNKCVDGNDKEILLRKKSAF